MTISQKTVVCRKSDGIKGVVVNDPWGCCTPEEVPVVFEGETGFLGTDRSDLEIIGPENAIPIPEKCGMGQGATCCIFLTVGPSGFCCERFSHLRYSLIFKSDMTAKRHPTKLFPDCMDQTPPKSLPAASPACAG